MHAESVPLMRPGVLEAIEESLKNPAVSTARHREGLHISEILESSRESVSDYLGSEPSEIVFVSSASEANTWALSGVRFPGGSPPDHLLLSPLEHVSVINAASAQEWRSGTKVSYLQVDDRGHIDLHEMERKWPDGRVLVSVQHANPETGILQPIDEIGRFVHSKKGLFHTDFTASEGWEDPNFKERPIDLISLSSTAIGGPSGIAVLGIRRGCRVSPLIFGGAQEEGRRGGTVPVFLACGMAEAVRHAKRHLAQERETLSKIDQLLVEKVRGQFPQVTIVGDKSRRRAGIINLLVPDADGQALLSLMDQDKVVVGTGSSCSAQSLKVSHVLTALGYSPRQGQGSVVLSLGWWNDPSEVEGWARAFERGIDVLGRLKGANPPMK